MTPTERKVGALEVIRSLLTDAAITRMYDTDAEEKHNEAEAAIADMSELIEADKEYDEAKYAHACIAHESFPVGEWNDHDERLRVASQRLLAAGSRRAAALARVGGVK